MRTSKVVQFSATEVMQGCWRKSGKGELTPLTHPITPAASTATSNRVIKFNVPQPAACQRKLVKATLKLDDVKHQRCKPKNNFP
jgi:hypothetical protein